MFSSDDLYTALNDSTITDLLDVYKTSKTSSTYSALFDEMIVPREVIWSTGDGTETINFYMSAPLTASDVEEYRYSINCRSAKYEDSRTMAGAVRDTINRVSYSDYYIVCEVLATIPPADATDVYNTPIEAIIKKR